MNHPYTTCRCPVGFIWCAHKAALLLNLHAMVKFVDLFDDDITFENITAKFPQPVHELVKTPITVNAIYPMVTSNDQKKKNQWKKMRRNCKKRRQKAKRNQKIQQRHPPTSQEDEVLAQSLCETPAIIENTNEERHQQGDIYFEEMLDELDNDLGGEVTGNSAQLIDMRQSAIPGIHDTSITPIIEVVENTEDWILALKEGRDHSGADLKMVVAVDIFPQNVAMEHVLRLAYCPYFRFF